MKKIYFILILLILSNAELFSQGWEKVYKDINAQADGTQESQITSDGGFIFIGYGYIGTSNVAQSYLIKTNSTGNVIWGKTFSDSLTLIPKSVIETNDGFLIGGMRYNPAESFLIKVNPSGNLLWSKKYTSAQSIERIQKISNGFMLLGTNEYNGNNGIYLANIDANGIIAWTKTFGANGVNPQGIAPAENNGFIIIGKKESYTYGMGDECHVMKFDSTGNLLWAKSYTYTNSFDVRSIKLTNSGDYILGGNVLMKIDKNGNLLWVKTWNANKIYDINPTPDNGFIIAAGDTWNIGGIFLVKLSSIGIPQWQQFFGNVHDQVTNVFVTADHGFLISGVHQDNINNIQGFYLIKTDSLGQSGCNTKVQPLASYQVGPSLCVINNVVFAQGVNSLSSNLSINSNSVSITAIDPCCYAKAQITDNDYYPCSGDSIHYSGSGAPHIQWYTGSTANAIVTKDTIVTLTITNTCGSFIDTLIVHPAVVPSFTYSINRSTICSGDAVSLNITGNAPYYGCYGNHVGTVNSTQYVLNPTETSSYVVRGYTGNYGPGCESRQTFTINVSPDKPHITKNADTLFSSSSINNQWLFNGNNINGATSQSLIINQAGIYSVKVTGLGCSNVSDAFSYAPDNTVYTRNAWQKMIEAGGRGDGTCIAQADDGGLMIGSNYYSAITKDDITLIKTDRDGEVLWSKTSGGPGMDHIYSIIKVDNGYVGVGSTTSFGNGNKDVYILSFDQNGQLLWSKTYGDWNDQEGVSIEQTSDGGFIVTGYSTNPHTYSVDNGGWLVGGNDLYLLKTDVNGNLLWSKVFDSSNSEKGVEVHETNDGNYIVAGTSQDLQSKDRVYVLKTDASGNLLWSKTIANSFFAETASMKMTPDNNYLFCTGASSSAYLLQLDDNGNVLWSKIAHVNTWGGSLIITNDNAAVFTAGFGYGEGALTKIDMNGDLVWSTNYNTSAQQYISKVIQLNDGSFLLTGGIDTTGSYNPGQINLINTDINGQTNCNQTFSPAITNETYSYFSHTTVASSLGTEMSALTNNYTGTFKSRTLCRSASSVTAVKGIPKSFLLKVYPNPTDGIINLEFPAIQNVSRVRVLDITGRCVCDEHIDGNSFYQVDLSSKNKGIYFVQIVADGKRTVKKIVLE